MVLCSTPGISLSNITLFYELCMRGLGNRRRCSCSHFCEYWLASHTQEEWKSYLMFLLQRNLWLKCATQILMQELQETIYNSYPAVLLLYGYFCCLWHKNEKKCLPITVCRVVKKNPTNLKISKNNPRLSPNGGRCSSIGFDVVDQNS